MTDKTEFRENGYYWAILRGTHDWITAYWSGDDWTVSSDERRLADGDFQTISNDRLENPPFSRRDRIAAIGEPEPGKNVVKFILTNDGDKIALELDGSKSVTESFDLVIENMTDRKVSTSSGGDLWKMTIEPAKERGKRG